MDYHKLFFCILLHFTSVIFAQQKVVGTVFDAETKEPLEGVSVFYDGTSIGTITDEKGSFSLVSEKPISALLVVSYIGYKSQFFQSASGGMGAVYLVENPFQLDEVVLKPDTWSREKKLNIFRREFLGTTVAGINSKIKNEDDIRLYYNKEKNTLFAYADVPIQIKNNHLGYKITYNLVDFEVDFGIRNTLFSPRSSYLAGTLFFSERTSKKTKKRHLKNRETIYLGSVLHFMRSLSKKKLQEENYKIFKDKFEVFPYSEYQMNKTNTLTSVVQNTKNLSVLFNKKEQSMIEVRDSIFYIDSYGNHSPATSLFFGGVFGEQRVGDMLPLDYVLEEE